MIASTPVSDVTSVREPLPIAAYAFASVVGIVSMLTSNPVLTAACVLTLLLLARLLWRRGEPPVLLFAAGYQWAQVSTLVFVADYEHKPVALLSNSPSIEVAIWLGLLGLLALAYGMRFGVKKLAQPQRAKMDEELRALSIDRVFGLYVASSIMAAVLPYFAWRLLAITQLLLLLGSVKWVFYILLGYLTLRRRTKLLYFVLATLLEIVAGIGFFSGFKTVFFVCALVVLSVQLRPTVRVILASSVLAVVVFLAGAAWMSIRQEYRNYLNQGTGQQVVLVSPTEQVTEFGDLVTTIDADDIRGSIEQMFMRLAYVDYFASVIDYVPKQRSFENGALILGTIRHLLMPRFLDPNKEVLESDSEITMKYTGLTVASSDRGTSIGIGYMAEAYVDFGIYGILPLVFLFGFIWGSMYRWLVSHGGLIATGLAFGTTLMIDATQFEIAELKLLGGMVARFLVLAVILRFVMPRLHRWMIVRGSTLPPTALAIGVLKEPTVLHSRMSGDLAR